MILISGTWGPLGGIGIAEIILTRAWYVWWERQSFMHGEDLQVTYRSAMAIGVLATNYWRAKKHVAARKKEAWVCPPEGIIKINWMLLMMLIKAKVEWGRWQGIVEKDSESLVTRRFILLLTSL
jgi:hypothetical protein